VFHSEKTQNIVRDIGRQELLSSTKRNTKSCTWEAITPGTFTHWGQPAGKHLCRQKTEDCDG